MRPSVEAQRREEVLAAAWQLICEVGYAQVRVADIARRAGLSTGIIHYYFRTKDEVLDAAFHHVVAISRARSLAALEGVADPWQRLVALVESQLPREATRDVWLIWLQLWSEASVREGLRELNGESYGAWLDLLEGVIAHGIERGAFRPVDARGLALRLATMMDGLAIQHAMRSDDVGEGTARELVLGLAAAALLGRAEP